MCKEEFENYRKFVNQTLDEYIPQSFPPSIFDSMRYSVLADGKRLRPVITLEVARMICGSFENAVATSCAIEMLHTQSLIHDDLPCMDNDDYRRGKLTNHKVFGEAIATLAGDALLSYAPQIIIQKTPQTVPKDVLLRVLEEFLFAAGVYGIIAGQVMDMESEGKDIDSQTLNFIHKNKTGALFMLAVRAGAMLAGASKEELTLLSDYAQKIGLAFQIADDILDETATLEELGKTPGKDKIAKKATYVSMYGLEESKAKLSSLIIDACDIIENSFKSDLLVYLTKGIEKRSK